MRSRTGAVAGFLILATFVAHAQQTQRYQPCPSILVERTTPGKCRVTFSFKVPEAQNVCLAGTFNQWSGDRDPMQRSGDRFTKSIELADGSYEYKYVVDGKTWKYDPENPENVDDTYGGRNSLIRVGLFPGSADATTSAPKGEPIRWRADLAAAQKEAPGSGKRIIVFFANRQADYARFVEDSLLTDARVSAKLNSSYLPVRLDISTPERAETAKRLGVYRSGVMVIYQPETGAAVGKIDSMFQADQLASQL